MAYSIKRVLVGAGGLLAGLIVLLVVAYLAGIIGAPSVVVEDPGDWGNTTDDETEIHTTLRVDNPNPLGIKLSDGVSAEYQVALNGVTLVDGEQNAISIPEGESTITLTSTLDNDKLVPWWVAYVRNNETIEMRATGSAEVSAVVSKTISFPAQEQTLQADQRPVIDAVDGAVTTMEGEYTAGVDPATVGYEIREASATWGEVTEATSKMNVTYRIHNPGAVAVPLVPDGFRIDATANDVDLFSANRSALTPTNVDRGAILESGETRTVVYTVTVTNDKVDDWFVSHVDNDEQTRLVIDPSMEFGLPDRGVTIQVPENGPGYACDFQTAILEDDQETTSNCGSGGSVSTG